MLLPDGEQPGTQDRSGYAPMTPGDLRQVIGDLDAAPLGVAPERGFRPSLPGFQRKALLGRAPDGTWQLPSGDAPSTWILKPDGPHAMAANEATCLRLAAACALEAAQTELLDVAGLPVLAARRYDRLETPGGALPVRLHQEDGCQATATPPGMKYEERGGPALRDLAGLLRSYGDPADVVSLSPLYDALSTIALELADTAGRPMQADTHLGQRVGGQADIRKVTAAGIVDEAVTWGIRRRTAGAVVAETLDRVLAAIQETAGDERVLAVISKQADQLRRNQR
jgi:serine/threonine-protein kinase HipA